VLQRDFTDIIGYWWKSWGGGYCNCCRSVDDLLDNWPDTNTYQLPFVEGSIHDPEVKEKAEAEKLALAERAEK
jgi:hypothetical protein